MSRPQECETALVTSDTTIKATPGHVYWLSIGNSHATDNAAVELQDGASTDRWACVVPGLDTPATSHLHVIFDPPIKMTGDIRLDISGGTVQATIGYR